VDHGHERHDVWNDVVMEFIWLLVLVALIWQQQR
jgi:hypothetical protein